MDIKKGAVKGIIWSAVEKWGSQFSSLIIFFLLARLLEPEAFGLVALANIFLGIMRLFLGRGFAKALIQRQKLEPEHLDTAFWTNLSIGTFLTLISFTTAPLVATLFRQPQLASILKVFSLFFVITSISTVQEAILARKFLFKSIALRSLLGTMIGGILGLFMAFSGFGVWSLVTQQLVNESIGSIVLWQASEWRPSFRFSKRHFQDLAGFGISVIGFRAINFFNYWINEFFIGYFLGTTALGYYTIAYGIFQALMRLLVNTVGQVALPMFSRLQEDKEQFRQVFFQSTRLISIVAFPTFLGTVVVAPEVVPVLFGEQWRASIPIIQILAFTGIIDSISLFKGDILMALGKPTWRLWQALMSTVINLVALAIAIQWGIVAVAIAYLLRRLIVFPVGEWSISLLIQTRLETYLSQFLPPLLCSGIMVSAIVLVKQALSFLAPQILLIICIGVGIIVYLLSIFIFARDIFAKLLEFAQILIRKIYTKED